MKFTRLLYEYNDVKHWIDYDFFGHQLVCHIGESSSFSNDVDGKEVPIPHFGIVLEWKDFDNFSEKVRSNGINFIIEPSRNFFFYNFNIIIFIIIFENKFF